MVNYSKFLVSTWSGHSTVHVVKLNTWILQYSEMSKVYISVNSMNTTHRLCINPIYAVIF